MKRLLANLGMGALCALGLVLLFAPLAGCTTVGALPAATTPAQAAQNAMLTAELAFNTAATAEIDAKAMGLIKPADIAQADALRKQAYQQLLGLRQVYATGATPNAAGLLLLTNQLLILSGKAPVVAPVVPGF